MPDSWKLRKEDGLDPRPDLSSDSAGWCDLLARACDQDGDAMGGLYQCLDGLRCLGARLEPATDEGARLVPGAIDPVEYRQLRARWLAPHRANLLPLLAAVRV